MKHGETLNIVAFRTTDKPWENSDKLTAPAHREDALKDFAGYSNDVMGLLKLTDENLDIVSNCKARPYQRSTDRWIAVGNLRPRENPSTHLHKRTHRHHRRRRARYLASPRRRRRFMYRR